MNNHSIYNKVIVSIYKTTDENGIVNIFCNK